MTTKRTMRIRTRRHSLQRSAQCERPQTAATMKRTRRVRSALCPRGKKAQKAATRLSVAELKQLVADPSLVDLHDPNSADPKLLIALKAVPHAVAGARALAEQA